MIGRMMKRLAWATVVLVCPAALTAVLTTQDGAFTVEQAERGRLVYEESCVNCHELEFYETKLAVWENAVVADLFDALSATMPSENPGGLLDEQYLDVLAYIFSITGSPPGDVELGLDNMASIEIVAGDFSLAK
jgi:mono/diheme cytochrome c family protein